MAVLRDNPYAGFNFTVDLGDGKVDGPEAGVLEVDFPEARLLLQDYRSGSDKTPEPRKVQTQVQYGNLVLRRGVVGALNWYAWWNEARNGASKGLARNVTVRLLSEDRAGAVMAWKFLRARPVCHRFSSLNALGAGAQLEMLELAFERLEIE